MQGMSYLWEILDWPTSIKVGSLGRTSTRVGGWKWEEGREGFIYEEEGSLDGD